MRALIKNIFYITFCLVIIVTIPPGEIFATATQTDTGTDKSYTVTFKANGGEEIADIITVTYGKAYGKLPDVKRKNYSFIGWYTFTVGGQKITESDKVDIKCTHTLYAHWRGEERKITLDANGGTLKNETVSVYFGSKFFNQLPVPVKKNLSFEGWYTAAAGGDKITSDIIFDEKTSIKLFAHWAEKSFKLILIGFIDERFDMEVYIGKAYGELPIPEREGYEFGGWYSWKDYADYDAVAITKDSIVTENSQKKLFARWYIVDDHSAP